MFMDIYPSLFLLRFIEVFKYLVIVRIRMAAKIEMFHDEYESLLRRDVLYCMD